MDKVLIKQLLFHGSWLVVPFMAWLLWRLRRAAAGKLLCGGLLLVCMVFVWARFVEPQLIQVRHTTLTETGIDVRIALISDIHLGVYKDSAFLQRVVDRINRLSVDAVVIAGDFTYEPKQQSLSAMFAPLGKLHAPAYAVLGNHDQQAPGPDIDLALRAALTAHGVHLIEGRIIDDRHGYRWAGLGDRWAGKDNADFIRLDRANIPIVVIAHNPDSAMQLTTGDARLVLAGHTHGGQIRIPWLYRKAIPSSYGFDRGEQVMQTARGSVRVFTTSGVGEVGLPLRLFNPPTIDVLQLQP